MKDKEKKIDNSWKAKMVENGIYKDSEITSGEKQIEEILTDIRKFIGYDTPYTQKKALADYLFEHYQPKLPKGSVVLSKEKLKEKYVLKSFYELAKKVHEEKVEELENLINYWIENWKQANKETTEKILNELNNIIKNNEDFGRGVFGWKTEEILMLLKIYADKQGVEIKEDRKC